MPGPRNQLQVLLQVAKEVQKVLKELKLTVVLEETPIVAQAQVWEMARSTMYVMGPSLSVVSVMMNRH